MKEQNINDGLADRLKASWKGAKTAVGNIANTVSSAASGVPSNTKNVQGEKIKTILNSSKSKIKPFLRGLNSNNLADKLTADVKVKEELLVLLQDLTKVTGEKNIGDTLKKINTDPLFSDVKDYLIKLKILNGSSSPTPSAPVSTSASTPVATPKPTSPAVNNTAPSLTNNTGQKPSDKAKSKHAISVSTGTPGAAQTVKSVAYDIVYDAAKDLWHYTSGPSVGKDLSKQDSDAATTKYLNNLNPTTHIAGTKPTDYPKTGDTYPSGSGRILTFDDAKDLWVQDNGSALPKKTSDAITLKYIKDKQAKLVPESINRTRYKQFFL